MKERRDKKCGKESAAKREKKPKIHKISLLSPERT